MSGKRKRKSNLKSYSDGYQRVSSPKRYRLLNTRPISNDFVKRQEVLKNKDLINYEKPVLDKRTKLYKKVRKQVTRLRKPVYSTFEVLKAKL